MDKNIKILFVFSIIFLILKLIAIYFSPLGLHGDEAQYWSWSKNLQAGYFSKPPMLPFLIRIFGIVFGDSVFAIKIISIIIYILIACSIFLLAKKIFNAEIALMSSLSFFLLPGVSFSSFIVSTDVPLLLFWVLSLYFFICFQNNHSFLNAMLLGIFLALGFLSKYAMIYFFICTFVYFLFNKNFSKDLMIYKWKFILIILIFLIIISPNILWNINNGWLTLGHTLDNISPGDPSVNFTGVFNFSLAQVAIIGPIFFIFFILLYKEIFNPSKKNYFLLCFSIPVMILILFESILYRAHGNWAAVSFVCFIILIISNSYPKHLKTILFANYFNLFLGLIFFFIVLVGSGPKLLDQLRGYENFSNQLNDFTNIEKINNIVIQDRMLFSLVNYHLKNTGVNILTPKKPNEKITNHFQINYGLPKNFEEPFLYIGYLGNLNYLTNKFTSILVKKVKINSKKNNVEIYRLSKID